MPRGTPHPFFIVVPRTLNLNLGGGGRIVFGALVVAQAERTYLPRIH